MAIRYNKQVITKDRRVMPSGPRDRQRKQRMEQMVQSDHSELIEELRHQISVLQSRLDSQPAGGWTDDKVNEEIIKAIKVETAALNADHKIEIAKLSSEVDSLSQENKRLKSRLKDKDKKIEELESRPVQSEDTNKLTALLSEATKKN